MATNSNEVYEPQKKTTKLVRGIHSWIKFQKHQGVESLTIQGKQALADVSQDKNGDANLVLKADRDKVDYVHSNVPYLRTSHTQDGTDPYQEKTAVISQDLTQFPINDGQLVSITKAEDSLTIQDENIKTFVNTTVTTKETEIKQFIGEVKEELTNKINEHGGTGTQIDYSANLSYRRMVTYNGDPCAYFHLTDCLISESILIYVHYQPASGGYANIQQYISSQIVTDYVNNNVEFGSPLYDGIRIMLPEKVSNATFEVITLGHVSEMDKINQPLALTSNTSIAPYTPRS
ncbi:Head fiber [Streptococcus phage CP-7]|uniref:Head fiber n=1 Tax=Streptococcus phage Cp-7 TaxID=10748 RepID=A0A068YGU5_BPCP7|nr:Head fiber [Streptococcus phage CP-7]CDS43816.1 Head fiber [Streptococcus phage CP-7]